MVFQFREAFQASAGLFRQNAGIEVIEVVILRCRWVLCHLWLRQKERKSIVLGRPHWSWSIWNIKNTQSKGECKEKISEQRQRRANEGLLVIRLQKSLCRAEWLDWWLGQYKCVPGSSTNVCSCSLFKSRMSMSPSLSAGSSVDDDVRREIVPSDGN